MTKIKNIFARQILDSRGNPTIEVDVTLNDGTIGRAAVPSGASTGMHEALELRDQEKDFFGKGVNKAVNNINSNIREKVIGLPATTFHEIDKKMLKLDGTENKSQLGANAILGVSLACIHAAANASKFPLYRFLSQRSNYTLPGPMMNILNGGSHADNNVDIQEFMICPFGASSYSKGLQMGVEIFHHLKKILKKNGLSTSIGDEGGFAPNLSSNKQAIDLILESIEMSGYNIGSEIFLALDVASSEFYDKDQSRYYLESEKKHLNSDQMISYYSDLCKQYPIVSIEDGLDENDWGGWTNLMAEIGSKVQVVGDDLTVTNINKLQKAIDQKAINSILIKLNQIGSVSETLQTISLAIENNVQPIISHRSGETEDTTIADLAVATGAGQIKTGSLCRTDRTCKYNQLIRIEEDIQNNNLDLNYFSSFIKIR
tara:strand:+ start:300 stop:1589 length:1290 start_codon:yes stop_codon:yes gene_type:complete